MINPNLPFIQKQINYIPVKEGEHKGKIAVMESIVINTNKGPIPIQQKFCGFRQSYDQKSQGYQDLTKTIGTETRKQPPPAENVQRGADPQRQAAPENAPQRGANEPAQPQSSQTTSPTPARAGESAPSQGAKASESYSPPSQGLFVPGKGTQPFQGLSGEQKATIYQQVLLAARLFSVLEKGDGTSPSASRIFLFLQQFKSLDQDCAKLDAQVRQMMAQGKNISPEQSKQLNTALQALQKQFEGLQKQAHEAMPQSIRAPANEALPKDLQKAIALLKENCDKSILQMQNQLQGRLEKLAGEINLKMNAPPSETENTLKAGQKSLAESAASTASTAAQAEKGARSAASLSASLSISESTAQAGAEARATNKPSTQLPQLILSSSDLHALNDKLQRKDLVAPLNIALVYPFNPKEQNQTVGGVKTGSKKGKEEQSSEAQGGGGGGHTQEMVLIPAGPVIFEGPFLKEDTIQSQIVELDAFLMAAFPVTNEQFADWLNEAAEEGKVKIDEKGIVRDQHRNVLCMTHWAAPTSQIETEVFKDQMIFKPLKGTQRHPVVQVSWYGAVAYCNDNHFRLPTEAEWEKAAGMPVLQEGEPLKKFRFGFGKDEIDLSWANYRDEWSEYEDNRTSLVGFYNGGTVFTKGGKSYQSQYACSPYGCYDMSGNVRQWVNEEKDVQKVAKGGSYNSPPSELSVAARSLFSPQSCQSDTGFRVAFDL